MRLLRTWIVDNTGLELSSKGRPFGIDLQVNATIENHAELPSVWRPLTNIVEDCPLAICDPSSIDPQDLVAADRVTPDFRVQLYYLRHNPSQKWRWISKQAPNELWAFVNYDSRCRLEEKSTWKSKTAPPLHTIFVLQNLCPSFC
jgi:hypothetical protein